MSKIYKFKQDKIDSSSIVHGFGNNFDNLSNIINNYLKVLSFEKTTTAVASGDTKDLGYDISETGYIPIGIIGIRCTGTRSSFVNIYQQYVNGTTAHVVFRNTHASNPLVNNDTKILIYILYKKNN